MPSIPETIEGLAAERTLPDAALKELLENSQADPALFSAADKRRRVESAGYRIVTAIGDVIRENGGRPEPEKEETPCF